ncbi:MAG: hypothetical protein Q7O66_07260 [Dehalococcoidia bacterium]|nr:hypothetical protein [Dehalococcoidia bacterium]
MTYNEMIARMNYLSYQMRAADDHGDTAHYDKCEREFLALRAIVCREEN